MNTSINYFKKLLLTLLFSGLFLLFSNAQLRYCQVRGKIVNRNFNDVVYLILGKKPFLDYKDLKIIDSVSTNNGFFSFKILVPYTELYSIRLKNYEKGFVFICNPGGKVKIESDTSNFFYPVITGSYENKVRRNYINGVDPLIVKMNNYADSAVSYMELDSVKYRKYLSLNDLWGKKIRRYNLDFILKYPKNLTSLGMFNSYYELFTKDSVKEYINKLPEDLKHNPIVKEIEYKKFSLEPQLKKVTKFYDIKYYDTLNQLFSFDSLKGKLVLIDFWASWCKPCIENFPYLKDIEKKYRDRNFAIIGVSLDENLDKWKRGIINSSLSWVNISDLEGSKGVGAKYFNVESIPRYVLLGKDGLLIDDNVKSDEIEKIVLLNL